LFYSASWKLLSKLDLNAFDRCWPRYATGLCYAVIERRTSKRARLFGIRDQRGVASGSGCVDRHALFGRKARQVMWSAGLRARARQPLASERLYPDHSADHAAVYI